MSGLDLLLSQRHLVTMLLYAGAVGFGLGLVYDLLGILRLVLLGGQEPTAVAWRRVGICLRFVGDFLFVMITALAMILLSYYTNDGRLRAPAVLGAAAGLLVWRRTLGRVLLWLRDRLLARIMRLCARILGVPCHLVARLVRWLTKPLAGPAKRLVAYLRRLRVRLQHPTPVSSDVDAEDV